MDDRTMDWSNEAGIGMHVFDAVNEVIVALRLRGTIRLEQELPLILNPKS
jgi:hypothetical protein